MKRTLGVLGVRNPTDVVNDLVLEVVALHPKETPDHVCMSDL